MKPIILNDGLNKKSLWNGCILASIAHGIMVAHYPELSYEHSWDGINYSVVDGSGGRGTITFKDKYCVGAFRNDNVTRTEFSSAIDFYKGAPPEVLELSKNETLEYLLEEGDDGMSRPYITTAFWADDDRIFSNDNIVRLIQNGGYLLERQLMEYDSAVESWRDYYEMTNVQVDLLESIYTRKIKKPEAKIILTKREIKMIGTDDHEGLSESSTSFEEIGIQWES
ncbi:MULTISPECIES: hypothetical protein [Paenibacillus]|uniref:Uncharacterized protein n=1 Tax=Paenibacillus campinasensis TaxID=66347 RepID=A0A268F1B6_9BACL|nr:MULTISPECIES: hypothetical protein [Paenibacillus]MUG68937.1 hypothetical protein [Paenibacillus campinasensis]PAD79178.1 hypothetical protein CHH67_04390 [Paenibacillus campinasensis]PAK54172.1 hypothetical protein CHH75_07580 [Paenibacillus sp. 7541]